MSSIAFKPEDMSEAKKEFRGQIVATDYGLEPFGMEGAPGIEKRRPQLCIQIRTDAYEKEQYEWYPPTAVRLTKSAQAGSSFLRVASSVLPAGVGCSEWAYFIDALNETGALKDCDTKGKTEEERMKNFAKSLVGMEFHFMEKVNLPCIVKGKTLEIILPVEYFGKSEVKTAEEIREEKVPELG